jgi:hypothetical protein
LLGRDHACEQRLQRRFLGFNIVHDVEPPAAMRRNDSVLAS